MDRRIKKNQEAIMNALISLMAEKEFGKITINEIAERANVNRGTIYSHYLDKYDLLDKCIEAHLEQLIESCLPEDETGTYPSKSSLLRTFEIMEKNSIFYTVLLTNKGVPAFRNRLQEMMNKGIQEQIVENNISLDMHKDILVQFLSSATVGVIEWWFTRSMPYSAKDITEQLWTLLELNQMIPRSHS
jgi:AcrR family transcriptional regulator